MCPSTYSKSGIYKVAVMYWYAIMLVNVVPYAVEPVEFSVSSYDLLTIVFFSRRLTTVTLTEYLGKQVSNLLCIMFCAKLSH